VGWLFVLPALAVYALFVLTPLAQTVRYSFYRWNGIGEKTWVGLSNYRTVLDDPDLFGSIRNSLWLVLFFSVIPVTLGLLAASVMHRVVRGRFGTVARTVLFLPQVIPLVAAGIICGLLGISRLAVVLFMLSGLLVMWQSTLLPPWNWKK